jgi:hypothetical protein
VKRVTIAAACFAVLVVCEGCTVRETLLADIGAPDEVERIVDDIQVVGSELTDDHVQAIRRLTDDTKPTDQSQEWRRGIIHVGVNRADHIWQSRFAQSYQKLKLVNGKWTIVESGGGLGRFD